MPQASDDLRDLMGKWFGSRVSDEGPVAFLCSRGYVTTPGFCWKKPTPAHTVHPIEEYCILFLIHEWDFGGISNGYDILTGT